MSDIVERLKGSPVCGRECQEMRAAAVAEIERLQEVERLYKAGCEQWNPVYQVILKERDELRAEIERLSTVIKQSRLCDPRYCTFGNENEIDRLRADLRASETARANLADEIERLRK